MANTVIDIGTGCQFAGLTFSLSTTGSGDTARWVSHGNYVAGATLHWSWEQVVCKAGFPGQHFFVQVLDETGAAVIAPLFPGCGSGARVLTATLPRTTQTLAFVLGDSLEGSSPNAVTLTNNGIVVDPCGPPCVYGTRVKTGITRGVSITESFLTNLLTPYNALWLLPTLAITIGADLLVETLCSDIPPVMPAIDSKIQNASLATALQVVRILAWPNFCECVPGTPSPNPPPTIVIVEPPGIVVPPTFPCDPAALCDAIVRIQQMLFQLQSSMASELSLTTTLQRYELPFAFQAGVSHGPVTGQGSFNISRLVGLNVQVTASAPGHPDIPDVPPYLWDRGWISVSDGGALLQERRVNRASFQWLPIGMPLCTSVGYSLTVGTSMVVQELLPEP